MSGRTARIDSIICCAMACPICWPRALAPVFSMSRRMSACISGVIEASAAARADAPRHRSKASVSPLVVDRMGVPPFGKFGGEYGGEVRAGQTRLAVAGQVAAHPALEVIAEHAL